MAGVKTERAFRAAVGTRTSGVTCEGPFNHAGPPIFNLAYSPSAARIGLV
jgi:hypothetical protein